MALGLVFIATSSRAFSTLGDFISPFSLAGWPPAGKKQLLGFGHLLGGEWKMTSEHKKERKNARGVWTIY